MSKNNRYKFISNIRYAWELLILIIGLAVAGFLVFAITLFINESWLPAALSTLGSIVTGSALRWLIKQRNHSISEEEKAYDKKTKEEDKKYHRNRGKESRNALFGRLNNKENS